MNENNMDKFQSTVEAEQEILVKIEAAHRGMLLVSELSSYQDKIQHLKRIADTLDTLSNMLSDLSSAAPS